MNGVLPYQELKRLVDQKFLKLDEKFVKPASVDIPIASEAYELESAFLPPFERVLDFIKQYKIDHKPFDLSKPLKKGKVYLILLDTKINLPAGVWGLFSPKSSTGRVDLHVRAIAENSNRFDFVPDGFTGKVWLLVTPKSFDIKLYEGIALTQLRLFSETGYRIRDIEEIYKIQQVEKGIINGSTLQVDRWDGGVVLTLGFDFAVDAWVSKPKAPVLDLSSKVGSVDPLKYFDPIQAEGGRLVLEKDKFYLLSTSEGIRLPGYISAEFLAMDANLGEFRSHYAGFIDPGWGYSSKEGRTLTLEVRPFEDTVVVHGQRVAKLFLDKLIYPSEVIYDDGQKDAHYKEQKGPRLAKYFRLVEKSRAG